MVLQWIFGRPVYIPMFFDYSHGIGRLVLTQIYQSPILSWFYKLFKWIYRQLTGTSELYRICDQAVKASQQRALEGAAYGHELRELASQRSADSGAAAAAAAKGLVTDKDAGAKELESFKQMANARAALVFRIDRCLLYSTSLTEVRRLLEARDSHLDEPLGIVLNKKGFPSGGAPDTPQALLLRQCMSTIISSHRLVHDLNARAATKYDPTNTLHEEKLLELWDLLAPSERLVSRISDQWQKIGFQGKDPATDFRGMGMLGLDNLHYYAKIYPDSVRRVLALSHHPTAWFSFAIVGINITDFALQLLRTRQLQHFLYTFGTSREVFMEFYCYCFEEFATYWSLQPMVTVMDFGRVFGEFQTRIQMELIRCRETILDPESPVFSKSRKKA
ncbi:hypothetical protein HDU85_000310 [Gaertneriomyces sp. JEL0708]|nr:hypothetical protein HDU85_000310 [Gaertneriomyces sp. JEL0708]